MIALTHNVEVHTQAGRSKRMSFGFKTTTWVDHIFAAILLIEFREGLINDGVENFMSSASLYCLPVPRVCGLHQKHRAPKPGT